MELEGLKLGIDLSVEDSTEGRIVKLHERIHESMRRSVVDAIEIGRLLLEKRTQLAHGLFMRWIGKELPFSPRTARRYMQLYEERDNLVNVSSLTDAYRVLADTAVDLESELQQEPDTGELDDEVIEYAPVRETSSRVERARPDDYSGRLKPEAVEASIDRMMRTLEQPQEQLDYLNDIISRLVEMREKILDEHFTPSAEEKQHWRDEMFKTPDEIERELQEIEAEDAGIAVEGRGEGNPPADVESDPEPVTTAQVAAGIAAGAVPKGISLAEARRRLEEKRKGQEDQPVGPVRTPADIMRERISRGEGEPPAPTQVNRGYRKVGNTRIEQIRN